MLMAKKRRQDIIGVATGLVGSSLILSVGASATERFDSPVAQTAGQGISRTARFLPLVGTAAGAGLALNALQDIRPTPVRTKKKKGKRRNGRSEFGVFPDGFIQPI